jgi:hypothetical protein
MSFRRADTGTVHEAEAFDASVRSKFEEFQNAHRAKFEGHRLPRPTAERYLKFLTNPDIEVYNPDELNVKQSAAQLFTVIDGHLHQKVLPGVPGQRRVIFDSGDVFDAIVGVHFETGHRGLVHTMSRFLPASMALLCKRSSGY